MKIGDKVWGVFDGQLEEHEIISINGIHATGNQTLFVRGVGRTHKKHIIWWSKTAVEALQQYQRKLIQNINIAQGIIDGILDNSLNFSKVGRQANDACIKAMTTCINEYTKLWDRVSKKIGKYKGANQ